MKSEFNIYRAVGKIFDPFSKYITLVHFDGPYPSKAKAKKELKSFLSDASGNEGGYVILEVFKIKKP